MSQHGARSTRWTAGCSQRGGPAWLTYDFCLPDAANGTGWTAPRHRVPKSAVTARPQEPSVMETTHIAVDTSKSIFTLHASDPTGRCTYRRDLSRSKFLAWFAKLAPLTVTLEACGGSHHWGRELAKLGHTVRLIAPQHAKPFIKRGKSDRADAEAISAAASRPSMRFVPVKNTQAQANAMVLKQRGVLAGERTRCEGALRGPGAGYGLVVP